MVVQQGDVVWITLPDAPGSAPAGRRPAVVLQHDRFNRTALATVVVVAVTSKLKYAELPGNVRLKKGEAGLARPSVVNVTQVATVDRDRVGPRMGKLSRARLGEVWAGVRLVCEPEG
ncbi:MAG TPA: type II toxin-antitoxin system PemK/MazF family toxin [Polyangiaceae bacterium]|jgi:mRNA interferase MazF